MANQLAPVWRIGSDVPVPPAGTHVSVDGQAYVAVADNGDAVVYLAVHNGRYTAFSRRAGPACFLEDVRPSALEPNTYFVVRHVDDKYVVAAAPPSLQWEPHETQRAGQDLRHADARGAGLEGANFRGADLRHAQFTGANLELADCTGAHLGGANFAGVRDLPLLVRAVAPGVVLRRTRGAFVRVQGADLTGADLRRASWHDVDASDVMAAGLQARRCSLSYADFTGADLRGADFRGARLERVNFTGANLEGARFEGVLARKCVGLPPGVGE